MYVWNVNVPESHKVSVYWIHGYRFEFLLNSIKSFNKATKYANLERVVVDFSVGSDGLVDRKNLEKLLECGEIDKLIFRDKRYCMNNNQNVAVEHCSGDFLLGLEDDTIFIEPFDCNWLSDCIDLLTKSDAPDAMNLVEDGEGPPHTMGFISSRAVRKSWGVWPSYPIDYKTITESFMYGDRARINTFYNLGFSCIGKHLINTSLSAPSLVATKLVIETGMSPEVADELVTEGARVLRDSNIDYIDIGSLKRRGGYKGYKMELLTANKQRIPVFTLSERLYFRSLVMLKRIYLRFHYLRILFRIVRKIYSYTKNKLRK